MKISTWKSTKKMSETSNQFDDRDVNDGGDADDPESFGVGNATACMTSVSLPHVRLFLEYLLLH
jgi:hypothetical protein